MTLWCRSTLWVARRVCRCSGPRHADKREGHRRFASVSDTWCNSQMPISPFLEIPAARGSCKARKCSVYQRSSWKEGQRCPGHGVVVLAKHLRRLSRRSGLCQAQGGEEQGEVLGWEQLWKLFPCHGPTPGGALKTTAKPRSTACWHRAHQGAPFPQTGCPRLCLATLALLRYVSCLAAWGRHSNTDAVIFQK